MPATPRDDSGPRSPAIRLADDERQRVIARLSDAFAQDVLAMDEFERRVEAVYGATQRSQLELLINDLPAPTTDRAPHVGAGLTASNGSERRRISAVFSSVERNGFAEMPRRLEIRALAGSVELDLSRSHFSPGVTEIAVRATLGSIELFLPAGVTIENDGVAFFGSFEFDNRERLHRDQPFHAAIGLNALTPTRPIVRITGRALLGSVEVTQVPVAPDAR